MRTTRTLIGKKAIEAIDKGVKAIYIPVSKTFGPHGKNALLYRKMNRGNRITNDGVTVAECQEPKDPFVRMAAQTFKESCKKTNEKVGDGTTCTTILGGKLFGEIYKKLVAQNSSAIGGGSSLSVISLKNQILKSVKDVKKQIEDSAKKISSLEDLEKVAIISVEDEEIGKIIAKMAWEVNGGKTGDVDGFIDVVEGYKGEIETEVIKGMRFAARVAIKGFINNPARFEMIAEDTAILLTNYKLDNTQQVADMLHEDLINKFPKIVILAPGFSEGVLNQLYTATYTPKPDGKGGVVIMKGKYDLVPIKIPSLRTEQIEDLAVYFNARFIDKNKGDKLSSVSESDLGFADKMIVKDGDIKEDAVVSGGGGTKLKKVVNRTGVKEDTRTEIEKRIEVLKAQIINEKRVPFKKMLERRVASMASAVGVIRVGDSTQASSLYRKLKIEDAVYACKAALRGGYVKGGGLCLKEIADKMDDDNILKTTLLAPYEQIQASVEGELKIDDNIIDPMEAVYYALEHSVQVVANLITCDSITCEEEPMMPGEGEMAIARALREMVYVQRKKENIWDEGQEEAYRDSMGGLNDDEFIQDNQD